MQIASDRVDDSSLAALGMEAAQLLIANEFALLSNRFGYALAFNRETASALIEDLAAVLAELKATELARSVPVELLVRHFAANDTGVTRVVECLLPTNNGKRILVELAVTTSGSRAHITLEQLSAHT